MSIWIATEYDINQFVGEIHIIAPKSIRDSAEVYLPTFKNYLPELALTVDTGDHHSIFDHSDIDSSGSTYFPEGNDTD